MHKYNRLLYVLALIKLILPFFLQHPVYEPHRDEFLYLAEGRHMAWGFMEVPPLLSVFAWLTHLFGNGFFWIKFWPSLIGALTFVLVGKLILNLGGGTYALVLAFLCFVFSAYMRVDYLFQPNFLEIFFYTLIAYSLVRYIQTNKNNWLYLNGLSMGLGMLSKYSIAFFILSVLIGLLLTRQRKIFLNRHFYFASILAFIIFLPNLLWQASHHFPVVFHMSELQETQLQYVSPVTFLIEQVVMFLPCFFVWMSGWWYVTITKKGSEYRFLGLAWVAEITMLVIFHGKSYYSLGLYPPLLAFGCLHREQFTSQRWKLLRWLPIVFIIVAGLWFMVLLLPVMEPSRLASYYKKHHFEKTGLLRWEDLRDHPLPQDFADMQGWEEMARKMGTAYATLDSNEKKNTILFCDNYGMAGAVNYYGEKYGLPNAYSDNASFLYWMPDHMRIDNLLLLTDDKQEMEHPFVKEFKSAVLWDSVTSPYAREKGNLIILLKGADDKFNEMFLDKIKKDKIKLRMQQ